MDKYEINLLSEMHTDFFPPNLYLIQSRIKIDKKEHLFSNDACYLNYPFEEAKKILPFFEKMKVKEQQRIVKHLRASYGFNTRLDDLFGKLLVTLFYNIELNDLLIVGLVGLGNNSIDTLINLVKRALAKEKQKVVILTRTELSLPERISVHTL